MIWTCAVLYVLHSNTLRSSSNKEWNQKSVHPTDDKEDNLIGSQIYFTYAANLFSSK